MDWQQIMVHLCSLGILIIMGSCVWLSIVLFHYVKKSRKLKRMLSGKEKMIIEDHEKIFSE